ncbi:MAG: cupin domain-containing protein [Rhodocyclaceae bacterium]|nr:cupin domain-containing protein [Rhodocyclaceae bacterium]
MPRDTESPSHLPVPSGNLFAPLPDTGPEEAVTPLLTTAALRVERIVSRGHASPAGFWYDQSEDEWVCLLEGAAVLAFAEGGERRLQRGDWCLIPAGCRHRVVETSAPAVWLAVFCAAGNPGAP